MQINIRVCVRAQVLSHHGDCERVDAADVMQAVLPGDEAFYIDEELVPQRLKGLVILLIPAIQDKYTHASHVIGSWDFLMHVWCMYVSYLLARLMDSGLGGGTIRQTEGTSISSPPGPVTSHLLRSVLSFRMPRSPLQITFCSERQKERKKWKWVWKTIHRMYIRTGCSWACYLILSEVTQCLYFNRAVTLLLWVSWSESHNALRLIDQLLDVLLVLHKMRLLFLMTQT